jgi:hypothetical protein
MIKFINKLVYGVKKLQNFFYFIQALQTGLSAFSAEWTKLTGQNIEDVFKESETEKMEVKKCR